VSRQEVLQLPPGEALVFVRQACREDLRLIVESSSELGDDLCLKGAAVGGGGDSEAKVGHQRLEGAGSATADSGRGREFAEYAPRGVLGLL
jgi:hypothetical protein